MDIGIFLIDIIAALGMIIALSMLLTHLTFTESGGCMIVDVATLILTALTFLLFRSIRYPIVLTVIGMELIFYTYLFLTIFYPRHRLRNAQARYYGQQVYEHLKPYSMIPLVMYGKVEFPQQTGVNEVFLFVDPQHYDRFFHEQKITNIRWMCFLASGKMDDNNYRDKLFMALIIDRDNLPSLTLPFFAGYPSVTKSDGSSTYSTSHIWSIALSNHYHGVRIAIYPLNQTIPKPASISREAVMPAIEQIRSQQHTVLDIPQIDLDELGTYWGDNVLRSMTRSSSPRVPHLLLSRNDRQQDGVNYAIKLAERDKI